MVRGLEYDDTMRATIFVIVWGVLAGAQVNVVYDGAVSKVTDLLPGQADLWLTYPDLARVSGFEIKPQGACLGELCVPLPKSRRDQFLRRHEAQSWFNLSELARVMGQPELVDTAHAIRVFGPRPEVLGRTAATLEAPDFTLPDAQGRLHSLRQFRGKKVLLITWASW
jgi:hypothetical protein